MSTIERIRFGFECVKIGAILVGGLLALYEYRRFRRYGAKAELDLDFDIFSLREPSGSYLLDIRPTIKNLGSIRQRFPIIEIWAKTLTASDVATARANKERLGFGGELVPMRNIVQEPTDPYFVDPGVTQVFPYQVDIMKPGDFIQVAVRFFYQVSWATYLWLRIVSGLGRSQRWQGQKKIERLKKYRIDEYHIVSKLKQVKEGPIGSLNV